MAWGMISINHQPSLVPAGAGLATRVPLLPAAKWRHHLGSPAARRTLSAAIAKAQAGLITRDRRSPSRPEDARPGTGRASAWAILLDRQGRARARGSLWKYVPAGPNNNHSAAFASRARARTTHR